MKRVKTTVPAFVAVVFLAGCASAPDYKPPEIEITAPAMWTAGPLDTAAVTAANTEWWTEFGEPELDSLVSEALVHNYDLVAAAGRVAPCDDAAAAAQHSEGGECPRHRGGVAETRRGRRRGAAVLRVAPCAHRPVA